MGSRTRALIATVAARAALLLGVRRMLALAGALAALTVLVGVLAARGR